MIMGYSFGMIEMFWNWIQAMVVKIVNVLNATELFMSKTLFLCEFHLTLKSN